MKKILHIANFNLIKTKGCSQNSTQIKISNGLIRNGYQVINYSDRDMARMLGMGSMNFLGLKRLQQNLLRFCKEVQPDAIISGHVDTVTAETWAEIKRRFPQIKILEWNVDSIAPTCEEDDYSSENIKKIKNRAQFADFLLITTAQKDLLQQLENGHTQVGFLPNIVDRSLEYGRAFEHEHLNYDLMLACNPNCRRQFCGKFKNVEEIAQSLIDNVSDLRPLFAGLLGNPRLEASHYQQAYLQCAMGFSLNHINDAYLYSSDRLAHMVGNGLLAFVDIRSGYSDLFSTEEMVFYQEPNDLYEKIAYYKFHPQERMKIARAGYEKYYKLFNEVRVTRYIADLLEGKKPQDILS